MNHGAIFYYVVKQEFTWSGFDFREWIRFLKGLIVGFIDSLIVLDLKLKLTLVGNEAYW